MSTAAEFAAVRMAMAALTADVASDAIGTQAPKLAELFAPEAHAAALDPGATIVRGARGTGKSFWAGVLGDTTMRHAAATAYPRLGLESLSVKFGFTGIEGPEGIGRDKLEECVPESADPRDARAFWWATILRALAMEAGQPPPRLPTLLLDAREVSRREPILARAEQSLRERDQTVLIVYDALDTVAASWPRRRLLTEALLEVSWGMRAYRMIRVKLFLRPDQLEDDALRFVELPKLRTGAVRLTWSGTDLYGMLFARLALGEGRGPFTSLLSPLGIGVGSQEQILKRQWPPSHKEKSQRQVMSALAGPYMGDGTFAHKKGDSYDWPLSHLSDAFKEVTPRSFLGLMISAAQFGAPPPKRVITPSGIRHGLRAASKTRVDQLHQEFPWIKGVLAPLAGLLLPQEEKKIFAVWKRANTLQRAMEDSARAGYLPPAPVDEATSERVLYTALERIGVMMRRKDGRVDMPDLFRVAAKLLKKGGMAPLEGG